MPKWPQTAWHFDVEPPKKVESPPAKQRQPYFPTLRQAYRSEINGKWIAAPANKRVASAPAALEAASVINDEDDVKSVHSVAASSRAPSVRSVAASAVPSARAPSVRSMAVSAKAPSVRSVKAASIRSAAVSARAPSVRSVRSGAASIRSATSAKSAKSAKSVKSVAAAAGTAVQAKPPGKLTKMVGSVRAWFLAIRAWIVAW
ncbi:hypothetical protein DIRU0_B12992 [Diutina rugosa]